MSVFERVCGRFGRRAFSVLALVALAGGSLSRPAQAIVYHGQPNLPLAVSLVVAGGGPAHFSSMTLYKQLTGPLAAAETAKLQAQFGDARINSAFAIFDYAIDDVLLILTRAKTPLPGPDPKPGDARALALALYGAGQSPSGKWDVGYMLERLISHPVHHEIMQHIDQRFSPAQNASFHVVLAQMMHDLNAAYTAPAAQPGAGNPPSPASGASATTALPSPATTASP